MLPQTEEKNWKQAELSLALLLWAGLMVPLTWCSSSPAEITDTRVLLSGGTGAGEGKRDGANAGTKRNLWVLLKRIGLRWSPGRVAGFPRCMAVDQARKRSTVLSLGSQHKLLLSFRKFKSSVSKHEKQIVIFQTDCVSEDRGHLLGTRGCTFF